MNTHYPSVAIGILNWNGQKFLAPLLPELERLTYPNFTIYVIDNNSADHSVAFVKEQHPTVRVIELNDNYGFAGGYNRGFALMEEDFLLMINSDVEVSPGFIEPLVALMQSDANIALCQPKLLSLTQPTMLEHAGAAGGMMDMLGYPFCRGRIFEVCEADNGKYDTTTEIFWGTGAACLIRRDAYHRLGGMYDYFFMHSEEIDLCWRMLAVGYKIMYCPASTVYHLGGGSLAYHSPRKTYLNFRNNIIMCFRNSPWYINLWLMPVRIAMDSAAAIKFLLQEDRGNFKAVVKAYWHFFVWIFNGKDRFPAKKKSLLSIPVVLKHSIVWKFYIGNTRFYSQLSK